MKKKIVAIMLAGMLAVSATACGSAEESSGGNDTTQKTDTGSDAETNATDETKPDASEDVTYQSILDDYTKQIQDATPGLIDEYKTESADIANDIEALATLSNEKIEKLAEINAKGTEEMATLMTTSGDEYETYEEWAGKLYDVYEEYAGQISDAYMDSASGISAEDMLESLQ